MAPPKAPNAKSAPGEVVCEPGRHVGCLHATMAERRAAAKAGAGGRPPGR